MQHSNVVMKMPKVPHKITVIVGIFYENLGVEQDWLAHLSIVG